MNELFRIAAAVVALIGGITLFVAILTPKRYTARRPRRFIAGWAFLALAAYLHYQASM